MTLEKARRVLGLAPGDDPARFLDELDAARAKIAEIVRTAPNETLALRYQEGLDEFDEALALIRAKIAADQAGKQVSLGKRPSPAPAPGKSRPSPARKSRPLRWVAAFLAIVILGSGGLWVSFRVRDDIRMRRQQKLVQLERQGAVLVEKRRWKEARLVYGKIRELDPDSPVATFGFRSIEAGIQEEHQQYIGYWTGEAIAAIDAKRWPDATHAIAKLEERIPGNPEITGLKRQLAEARRLEARQRLLDQANAAFERREWDEVRNLAEQILATTPDDAEAISLRDRAKAEAEREHANRLKARDLFEMARGRDTGKFDAQALKWAREARSLAPGDKEIDALYQKLSSYTRTLEVPGEFHTLASAVDAARPRDRIRLGEGTLKESVTIDKPVEIEGLGADKSILECEAADGPVLTWTPAAEGARISGVQLRHRAFSPGTERFSVALVRGGNVTFTDCTLRDGSGHGLAVIEGGMATLSRCKLENNGWDGVSAYGDGSRAEIDSCQTKGNFEHGFDVWDGATAVISNSTATENGRNGIFVSSAGPLAIFTNLLGANREFGIVVAAANGGNLVGNKIERNHLGGIALYRAAQALRIRSNTATRNLGPGLVLDSGFAAAAYQGNTVSKNRATRQIAKDVKLTQAQPSPPAPKSE